MSSYWANFVKTGDPNGPRPAGVEGLHRENTQPMVLGGTSGMKA